MQLINQLLFGVYPYIALAVLVLGSVIRFDREQYTWRSGSSQLLRRKQLVLGSVLFHVGVLAIFAGHFVGLLTPIWVFDALGVPHGAKQILAMSAGGIAGILCLAGGLWLRRAKVMDRYRIEVIGAASQRSAFTALGCFVEVIAYTARVFVPTDQPDVLTAVLAKCPVQTVLPKAA